MKLFKKILISFLGIIIIAFAEITAHFVIQLYIHYLSSNLPYNKYINLMRHPDFKFNLLQNILMLIIWLSYILAGFLVGYKVQKKGWLYGALVGAIGGLFGSDLLFIIGISFFVASSNPLQTIFKLFPYDTLFIATLFTTIGGIMGNRLYIKTLNH